jgi:hypothetical protein
MSEQNKPNQSTVYWNPDVEVVLRGAELAALFQIVDLQEVNMAQIPLSTLASIFGLGTQVKNTIVERMNQQGLLFTEPSEVSTVAEDNNSSTPFEVVK